MKTIIVIAILMLVVALIARAANLSPDTPPATDGSTSRPAAPASAVDGETVVRIIDADGRLSEPVAMPRVERSESEWRGQLSREQFRVLRESGTERANTGELLNEKSDGIFACAGCGLPLFASETKFKSGTGWPSFFASIAPENVGELPDGTLGMRRTEIICNRCDGHLGHVFADGPAPTGLRYCVNSASLRFVDARNLAELAETAPPRASVVIAGGCFWCVEAVFEELDGVVEAISGYAGGTEETANYKAVCSGRTDHAEAVQIIYDPNRISYEDLLLVHFATHDPTTLNRQGNDVGPQYRSAIFYADDAEKTLAEATLAAIAKEGTYRDPVVTTLEPLTTFYVAEANHQNYVCDNPMQGYVRGVALPKVEKVRKLFKDRLKDTSPLDR